MDTKHFLARLARICLTVFVILLSNLGCGDSTFVYQVSITEAGTSHPIENVLVRLEVATMSPLTGKSDSFGNARITIPSNYINRQGRLVIEMPGYKSFTQNLTLLANQLPTDVPLTRQGNIGNQSTPQATPTATVVPTTTSTEIAVAPTAAHPTATPTARPTTYPAADSPSTDLPLEHPPAAHSEPPAVSAEHPEPEVQVGKSDEIATQLPPLSGKLAFPLKINNEYKVYVVKVSDVPPTQLYASIGNARQPQLSPDGKSLLVDGTGDGDLGAILQMSSDGNGTRPVTCPDITIESYFPTWSPNGTQLAFDGGKILPQRRQIYIGDIDLYACSSNIGNTHLIVQGGEAVNNDGLYPVWAPDNWLYFRSCATWDPNGSGNCGIWSIQMDGAGFDKITDNPNHIPTDADSQHVLFMFSDNGNWDVYSVTSHASSVPKNLTRNDSTDIWGTLSPDGQTIAFMSNRSGVWAIWLMDNDGGNPRQWLVINTFDWGTVNPDEIYFQRMSWRK